MNDNAPKSEGDAAIPDSERWLHEPKTQAKLDQAIAAIQVSRLWRLTWMPWSKR